MAKQKVVTLRTLHTPLCGKPPIFHDDADAVQFAFLQGVFVDMAEAEAQIAHLRRLYGPACWAVWLGVIAQRVRRNDG